MRFFNLSLFCFLTIQSAFATDSTSVSHVSGLKPMHQAITYTDIEPAYYVRDKSGSIFVSCMGEGYVLEELQYNSDLVFMYNSTGTVTPREEQYTCKKREYRDCKFGDNFHLSSGARACWCEGSLNNCCPYTDFDCHHAVSYLVDSTCTRTVYDYSPSMAWQDRSSLPADTPTNAPSILSSAYCIKANIEWQEAPLPATTTSSYTGSGTSGTQPTGQGNKNLT